MTVSVLNTLSIGMAGSNTAISDGLAQSIKTLSSTKAKKNIAILLTDGRNTAGEIPISVAVKLAKKYNVKVYTIGMGRRGDYDRSYLEYIANETNGVFFNSSNEKALSKIYKEIDKLEKQKIKSNTYEKKTYYFYYPLSISIIALFIYIIIQSRKQL
jgi:Ca-activated chloride channel family protein